MDGCKWRTNSCNRRQWIYIIMMILGTVCVQICYDLPAALQNAIMSDFNVSASGFSLLFSLYSLPSVFSTIICGYLIDSFLGAKRTTILFTIISISGQALFAAGGWVELFWLMVFGRFIYGLGQEAAFGVCVNYYTFHWFKDSSVNLVFSLADNFRFIGAAIVFQISHRLKEHFQNVYYLSSMEALKTVIAVDSSAYILAFLFNIAIVYLQDVKKLETIKHETKSESENKPEDPLKSNILNEQNSIESGDNTNETKPSVKLFDFFKFPITYWLLCLTYSAMCNAVFTFEQFSQQTFTNGFSLTIEDAINCSTVMNISKMIFSIPVSIIVDRFGRNAFFVMAAMLMALLAHTCILFRFSPYTSMILLGGAYSISGSSIWSMFVYPLNKMHYGLGYGIVTSLINIACSLFPLIAGKIIDNYGLFWVQIFHVCVLAFGVLSIIVAWYIDKRGDGVLNMSARQRKIYNNV